MAELLGGFLSLLIILITYPFILLISLGLFIVENHHYKVITLQRSLNLFKHRQNSYSLERILISIAELKLLSECIIPIELVQAYIYMSKVDVYEVHKSTNKLSRVFKYDQQKDLIKTHLISLKETLNKDIIINQKQLLDLDPKNCIYLNYLPKWVVKI